MSEFLVFFLFVILLFFANYIAVVVPKFGDSEDCDDLYIPEDIEDKHSGNFHKVISYDHSKTVEVFTWHYGSRGCNSGFVKDFDIEMDWEGSRIVCIGGDNYNKTLKLFNLKRTHEKKLLIGEWRYRTCGCMVWEWRVV